MHIVRRFQSVVVRKSPARSRAVQQRWLRRATQDEGKLPGNVTRVHKRRIQAFAAERTGQMAQVARPADRHPSDQASDQAFMHLERRYPAQIGQPHIDTGPGIEQSAQLGC